MVTHSQVKFEFENHKLTSEKKKRNPNPNLVDVVVTCEYKVKQIMTHQLTYEVDQFILC